MKVLSLVTNRYAPFYQGQISSLESKGIEFDHIYPRKQSEDHDEQMKITRSYIDYLPLVYKTVSKSLAKYDLIHANNGKTAPFALMQPHRPVVLTLWGSDLMGSYSSITKRSARFCDEIIVRSDEMKDELEMDAHVIPAGVDLDVFRPLDQSEALEEIGWDPEKKHVLFPASPDRPVKNYPLAKSVVDSVDNQLGVPVKLQVVTGVPHSRIPWYMNAADALILTSEREGSPNTVKEAMACNTPVVSTDVGDVRKRLQGVSQSEICQSESEFVIALSHIIGEGSRSNGRKMISEISIERLSERIFNVYELALE